MIKSISEIYKTRYSTTVYQLFTVKSIELWLKCKQDLHEEANKKFQDKKLFNHIMNVSTSIIIIHYILTRLDSEWNHNRFQFV